MNKTTLAAALVAIAIGAAPLAGAQAPAPDASEVSTLLAKSKTPADKKALVASTLSLTDAEAKKFWPVYDAFQRKLDANQRRYSLAVQEAVMGDRVTDLHAKNLAKELTAVEDDESRARKSMYASVVKVLPGRKAIRYMQLESKLSAGYRYEVAQALPLIK